MVCMTPREAERSLQNKAEVGRWMGQANTLFDYYETLYPGQFSGASSQQ
jgi:hypothetical protein